MTALTQDEYRSGSQGNPIIIDDSAELDTSGNANDLDHASVSDTPSSYGSSVNPVIIADEPSTGLISAKDAPLPSPDLQWKNSIEPSGML